MEIRPQFKKNYDVVKHKLENKYFRKSRLDFKTEVLVTEKISGSDTPYSEVNQLKETSNFAEFNPCRDTTVSEVRFPSHRSKLLL